MPSLRKHGVRDLAGATVVITGASSGIGRATAIAFAEHGANLALAARDPGTLAQAAAECETAGGSALAVPLDVADEAAVEALARQAVERFGRIDVWVNNAGVILYGHFEETPSAAFRRVIETNLFGEIHGSRAALAQFRRQRRGVLINLASIWGRIPSPYVSAYVTSKFGVRAFSDCLRQGLADLEGHEDIHVCTILPESIDTPIFRHAANYAHREARPVPPIAAPQRVARTILRCAQHPRREVTVGVSGQVLEIGHWLMPESLFSWMVPHVFDLTALGDDGVQPTSGNLFEPMSELNRVDGGYRHSGLRPTIRGAVAAAAALAPAVAGAQWLRRRR